MESVKFILQWLYLYKGSYWMYSSDMSRCMDLFLESFNVCWDSTVQIVKLTHSFHTTSLNEYKASYNTSPVTLTCHLPQLMIYIQVFSGIDKCFLSGSDCNTAMRK